MMPLLFPTGDARGVTAVIDHSLRIMQPRPASAHRGPRELTRRRSTLAADRSYFNPSARKRVLVVFSDLDSDFFSLEGTLRLLRKHTDRAVPRPRRGSRRADLRRRRPPVRLRLREHGDGRTVSAARSWHAFEENEAARLVTEIRSYLGRGPVGESGLVESQRNLAPWLALAALALTAALVLPALRAGLLARA